MVDYKKNIIPHKHQISQEDRIKRNGHLPKLVWFTGLSGSGKSTLASALEAYFHDKGFATYILDGDIIRSGLNNDLDFSDESRKENIRRISEVSRLFLDAGIIVFAAFISPFKEDRAIAQDLIGADNFIEIYVDCSIEICEQRDIKGLYKKARAGEIRHFTGIDSPFEIPDNPDVRVDTVNESIENSLEKLIDHLESRL